MTPTPDRPRHVRERPRLLAVIPYGMALRNIVLNGTLWPYLIRTFEVDLLTPVEIEDPAALGVARVERPARRSLRALVRRLRHFAVASLKEMDQLAFYMRSNEGETFRVIYRYATIRGSLRRLIFLSWLGHSPFARPLRRLLRALGAIGVLDVVRVADYDALLLAHNAEHDCAAYGLAGNRARIPVVCIPMGVDNLMHGPLAFRPDLLLLWGQEQSRDFGYQVAFRPDLARTRQAIVGSTIHDGYLAVAPGRSIDADCGLAPDDEMILFAAHIDEFIPFQVEICRVVLAWIRSSGRRIRLVIRIRPGFDEAMWERFRAEDPDHVRLQDPRSAAFDKSEKIAAFGLERERQEVEVFAATMRRMSSLVTPSLSTMGIDAMLFHKPVINALFDPGNARDLHPDLLWYRSVLAKTPEWADMRIALDADELTEALRDVFERGLGHRYSSERLFAYRAAAGDGKAGDRAVAALREFGLESRTR